MLKRECIQAVGFDLDETLYPSNPQINDRIRTEIARNILIRAPSLKSIESARTFFEEKYKELQSGRKVLLEVGYSSPEASRIMDDSIANAEITDVLQADPTTSRIIRKISERYFTYLITSSPEENALKKLRVLDISSSWFHDKIYGDTNGGMGKQDGSAFKYALERSKIPAKSNVYIGNSLKSDILPAKSLGMQTIAAWSIIPEADSSVLHIHDLEALLL